MVLRKTLVLLFASCLLILSAGCAKRPPGASENGPLPSVEIEIRNTGDYRYVFVATGLPHDVLARLSATAVPEVWQRQFYVQMNSKLVQGQYHVEQGELVFTPDAPLQPGGGYNAHCWNPEFPRPTDRRSTQVRAAFRAPERPPPSSTVVVRIYPTAQTVPENLLKFYIHFSAPMSRGEAYRRIHLLDAGDNEMESPFLELDQELWNPDQTRFTLFLDPGRIKRELLPRALVGPALERGKKYTLMIDADWLDAKGHPLKMIYGRAFNVGPPDDKQPDMKTWKLTPPAAGLSEPLAVDFPEPLDHALLQRVLRVVDEKGTVVAGTIAVSNQETRWEFTPKTAWAAGAYHLEAETILEDLAGNDLGKPFEVDLFGPIQKRVETERVRVGFVVK